MSDRTSLLNDAFSLAAGDRLSYATALNLTKYLVTESSHVPWQVVATQLSYFNKVFYYTPVYANLTAYERLLVSDLYNSLGWEDEGEFGTKMLRNIVLELACAAKLDDCVRTAEDKFTRWMDEDLFIPPNLRSVVYKYGMSSNLGVWQAMFDKYMEESNSQEKLKLLNGLASTSDPSLLYKLVDMANNTEIVREQDYFTLLSYVSANRVGEPIVWDYVRNNWEKLVMELL